MIDNYHNEPLDTTSVNCVLVTGEYIQLTVHRVTFLFVKRVTVGNFAAVVNHLPTDT